MRSELLIGRKLSINLSLVVYQCLHKIVLYKRKRTPYPKVVRSIWKFLEDLNLYGYFTEWVNHYLAFPAAEPNRRLPDDLGRVAVAPQPLLENPLVIALQNLQGFDELLHLFLVAIDVEKQVFPIAIKVVQGDAAEQAAPAPKLLGAFVSVTEPHAREREHYPSFLFAKEFRHLRNDVLDWRGFDGGRWTFEIHFHSGIGSWVWLEGQ